jgi:hypothetical protein
VAEPTLFQITGAFSSPKLTESSGVAVSRRFPGVLWTHNDSGDEPRIYATSITGNVLAEYPVGGARAIDWEDIALGPCPDTPEACLYIGDIGDNFERREHVTIYIVREPTLLATKGPLPARSLVVRYAAGPRDSEALAVTAAGDVLLISRGRSGPIQLYRIARSDTVRDTVVVHDGKPLGIVPQRAAGRLATGAAVSPSGTILVVRTYTQLFFFRLDEPTTQIHAAGSCWLGLREPQGEAVDFLDDSTLVLTSEVAFGRAGTISRVRCSFGDERR